MSEQNPPTHTMLYKHREGPPNPEAWNLSIDTKVVEDSEIKAHQADGWLTAAEVSAAAEAKPARSSKKVADPTPAAEAKPARSSKKVADPTPAAEAKPADGAPAA